MCNNISCHHEKYSLSDDKGNNKCKGWIHIEINCKIKCNKNNINSQKIK